VNFASGITPPIIYYSSCHTRSDWRTKEMNSIGQSIRYPKNFIQDDLSPISPEFFLHGVTDLLGGLTNL
jgi:hypothetical protein